MQSNQKRTRLARWWGKVIPALAAMFWSYLAVGVTVRLVAEHNYKELLLAIPAFVISG
jgi:hypothetical protein